MINEVAEVLKDWFGNEDYDIYHEWEADGTYYIVIGHSYSKMSFVRVFK